MSKQNKQNQQKTNRPPLQIKPLIERFGVEDTRKYLQWRFSQPENFFEYTSVFADQLIDETPDFHREIIDMVMGGGRVAIGAPRGGAKSTLVGLEWLSWLALNGKYKFILYISDTFNQAKLHVGSLKAEIEGNELIQFIYPDAVGEKWGEEGITVNGIAGETFIMPLGAGMKVRGLRYKGVRPQLVIIDDLENLELVYSADRRRKLQRWFDFDLEPAMDRYNKNIVYVGTILHYKSLLKQVLHNEGKYKSWRTKIFKALYTDENGELRSFWPSRYSVEYLKEIRDNPEHPDYVGSIVFAQEYQNEPQDDRDRIIKLDWIKGYNFLETISHVEADTHEERIKKWLAGKEIVGGIDPAISEKETADFFSFYTYAFDKATGKEYQLDLIHDKIKDPAEQARRVADCVQKWGHHTIGVESVQYQAGLAQLIRTELQRRGIYNTRIQPIKTDKDKIRRARIHSVAFEGGFVLLRTDHQKYHIIKAELEEFPLGEHDDAFDSLMLAREARQKPKARVFKTKPKGF